MQRYLFALAATFLPFSVQALEFTNRSLQYTDAPFHAADAAGISVLTEVDAVSGYPDGSFQPGTILNRAEFLKIVLESYPHVAVSKSDAANCFPDVHTDDWFAQYVCLAKTRGIIGGYPDGTFKPENPVNYAEALKILGELYEYTAYADPSAPWYEVYVQGAISHKTNLPVHIAYDQPLTRGYMARLAAAYLAESEGELEYYRTFEQGETVVRSSSTSSQESSSSSEESESSSSEESSSSSSSSGPVRIDGLPATSRLLFLGETSDPLADGVFTPNGEIRHIRRVEVELNQEIRSLDGLSVIDEWGNLIADLDLDFYQNDDTLWVADFDVKEAPVLEKGVSTTLAVVAHVTERSRGGFPEELVQVENFKLVVDSGGTGSSYELIPTNTHFPKSQTVQSKLTGASNTLGQIGVLEKGQHQILGGFKFHADVLTGAVLYIEELTFSLKQTGTVAVTNWELSASHTTRRHSCFQKNAVLKTIVVSCVNIPEQIGSVILSDASISLSGDVTVGEGLSSLQLGLQDTGGIGIEGSIRWSDGTGHYTWIEGDEPIVTGIKLVTQ